MIAGCLPRMEGRQAFSEERRRMAERKEAKSKSRELADRLAEVNKIAKDLSETETTRENHRERSEMIQKAEAMLAECKELEKRARAIQRSKEALLSLCLAGDAGWESESVVRAAEALLEAIGEEERGRSLDDALKALARADSPLGVGWALDRGADLGSQSWGWLCAAENFAPNALKELGKRGGLEKEAKEWREMKEWMDALSHPILHR